MKKFLASVAIVATLASLALPISAGARTGRVVGPHANCRDGSYSYSVHRQGTCSWHGGVRVWLR